MSDRSRKRASQCTIQRAHGQHQFHSLHSGRVNLTKLTFATPRFPTIGSVPGASGILCKSFFLRLLRILATTTTTAVTNNTAPGIL